MAEPQPFEPVRGTLDSLKAFQRQPVDCDSSHRGSCQDTAEKQREQRQGEDQLHQTGVMVVGMGMKAEQLHKAADLNDGN